jgi:hypothetical protein
VLRSLPGPSTDESSQGDGVQLLVLGQPYGICFLGSLFPVLYLLPRGSSNGTCKSNMRTTEVAVPEGDEQSAVKAQLE